MDLCIEMVGNFKRIGVVGLIGNLSSGYLTLLPYFIEIEDVCPKMWDPHEEQEQEQEKVGF